MRPGPARGAGPRVHGRGHPLRPDPVAPGRHGLQGGGHRHRRPRRHPGPAHGRRRPRPTPPCSSGCSTSWASAGRSSRATRWAAGWSPTPPPDPQRAVAVVLIGAAVGECWDRLVRISRFKLPRCWWALPRCWWPTRSRRCPAAQPGPGRQAQGLVGPTLVGHALALAHAGAGGVDDALAERSCWTPWARRPRSRWWSSTEIATCRCPTRRRSTPRRSAGTLVTVKGGTHSWVLKDPETLPAIVAALLDGPLARGLPRWALPACGPTPPPSRSRGPSSGPTHWCAA